MIQKIVFISNSLKELPDEVNELISYCKKVYRNENISVLFTQFAGHSKNLSIKACQDENDLIVGIGGDGTLNEIINGIMISGNKSISLAFIPNGTGNDFCKAQHISFSIEKFITALENPLFSRYDVCSLKTIEKSIYFINIADAGFGGHTTHNLNNLRISGIGGGLSYTLAILRSFITFQKPKIELTIDGQIHYRGFIMMAAFCNSSSFGNGLIIYPEASPQDGNLNIALLADVGFWDYLKNYRNLKKGIKIKHPNVSYLQCKTASLKTISGQVQIEADGEIAGKNDFVIDVLPSQIKVMKY